jgi:pimeloyl-ACP methyl ester carboxylesterase
MPIADRQGAAVFYEEAGSGDPPLVLVHGVGIHEHLTPQLKHFSLRHRVIAPDLPGYGKSDMPDREYTVAAFADDIAWLCDELELQHPVIVGHSMAGAIAVEVAAARPELPSAIVLLDPIPITPVLEFRERMGPFVQALHGPGFREAVRGFAEGRMFRPTDNPDLRARIIGEMCAVPQQVVAATLTSAMTWNGEQVASQVQVPVLLIQAGDGIPADMARTRQVVPQLELGRTVGAGHFAHLIVADQVNAMIERFLAVSGVMPAAA